MIEDNRLEILEYNENYIITKNDDRILIYPKYKTSSYKSYEKLRDKVSNYGKSPYHIEFTIDSNFKLEDIKDIINDIFN